MKTKIDAKTGNADATEMHARLQIVAEALVNLKAMLPKDAARIEIDIEWADGGRVKMEGKVG